MYLWTESRPPRLRFVEVGWTPGSGKLGAYFEGSIAVQNQPPPRQRGLLSFPTGWLCCVDRELAPVPDSP